MLIKINLLENKNYQIDYPIIRTLNQDKNFNIIKV